MNKKYIKFAALAAIAVGGYLVIKNILKGDATKAALEPTLPATTPPAQGVGEYPIKKGSKGAAVRQIQNILVQIDANALPKYGVDGDFGSETEAALFKYLKKMSVDSFIDIQALQAIAESQAQQNVDETRKMFGNNLANDWRINRTKSFYAKNDTTFQTGNVNFLGQEQGSRDVTVIAGTLIVNGFEIKDVSVLPSGFIKVTTAISFFKLSPFGVILK